MASGRTYRRKNLLINKRFQFSILAYFLFISLMAILIFYISHLFFFGSLKEQFYEQAGTLDHRQIFELLEGYTSVMNVIFFGTAVIAILAICINGLYLSHRIAGPLYRLTMTLKGFKNLDDLREMKFRKHDFFPEIEDAFNEFLKKIKEAKRASK